LYLWCLVVDEIRRQSEFMVMKDGVRGKRKLKSNWILGVCGLLVLILLWRPSGTAGPQAVRLKLATTTSTDNSGLLQELLPPFEKEYNIKVDVVAVGTGKALALGRNADADVVFVHAREAEDEFVKRGHGVNRRDVMYNDFVIAGPPGDPAGIRDVTDASEAFAKVSGAETPFVSRGDDSGTHKKELSLWKAAEVMPRGRQYLETGQGMGATLQIASEKQGYVLVDRGTYIAYRGNVDLDVLCDGDPDLYNPYGIIAVNPIRHPHVRYMEAMMLIGWVTSPKGRDIIKNFRKDGEALFKTSPE
jgi:tungstate transport system substrate-binding protein